MDRKTEKRLGALKDWRGPRADSLSLDPGVLCPNAALEAIAWTAPSKASDLQGLPELKRWFVREFADEIVEVVGKHDADAAATASKESEEATDKPKRKRRGGRGRSGASRKKRARRASKKTEAAESSASESDSDHVES